MNLAPIERSILDQIIGPVAAGLTLVSNNSAPIYVGDCQGFEIITLVGSIADTGTVDQKLKHGDLADGSDLADVKDSAMTQMTTADDNKIWRTAVLKPEKAYISPNITRGTANSDIRAVLLIKHGLMKSGMAQESEVKQAKTLGSPISGTP